MNSTPSGADDAPAPSDRDPERLAAAAAGEIDLALFTQVGRGDPSTESFLADRPPVSYLRDMEAPQYLLPGESLTVRRHDGVEAVAGDRTGVYTAQGGHQAVALVTDKRIVFVAGRGTGDRVVELPFWRVKTASGERRRTNERLTVVDDRHDYVFTAATDAGVTAAADYLRELAVPATLDDGVRPGEHELLPTGLNDYAPEDATLQSAADGDGGVVRSDLAWLTGVHARLGTEIADDGANPERSRLLETVERLLSALRAAETALRAAASDTPPGPAIADDALTAVEGTPIDDSQLSALAEEVGRDDNNTPGADESSSDEHDMQADDEPSEREGDGDPFTRPNVVPPEGHPSLEDDAPELRQELQRLVGTLHRIPSREDVVEASEYDIDLFERYGDDWLVVLESAGYDLRGRMVEYLRQVDGRSDEVVTPADLTDGTYRSERYVDVFGDWRTALEAAELDGRRGQMLAAIQRCWTELDAIPDASTLADRTAFDGSDFAAEFGSVRAASSAAGIHPSRDTKTESDDERDGGGDASDDGPPRSPLSEWYDAVYGLSKLQRAIYGTDLDSSKNDPGVAWVDTVAAVAGSDGLDEWEAGYGKQHRDRADHTVGAYRDGYGDGDRVTDFAAVETVPVPESVALLGDGVDASLVSVPVAPDSGMSLPVVVTSQAELERGRELLSELPRRPPTVQSDEHSGTEESELGVGESKESTDTEEKPTDVTGGGDSIKTGTERTEGTTESNRDPPASVDETAVTELTTINGVDTEAARILAAAGYDSVESLASATTDGLTELNGIDEGRAFRITFALED